MNKNKYLLLASSLGVLALLLVAAAQENFGRDWRRIQSQAKTDEAKISSSGSQTARVAGYGTAKTSEKCPTVCRTYSGPRGRL